MSSTFIKFDKRYLPPYATWIGYFIVLSVFLSWIPLVMIARARAVKSEKPRIHIFQDMDAQPKYKAQAFSELLPGGRVMQEPVAGTVAWGHNGLEQDPDLLGADDFYYRGGVTMEGAGEFQDGFPDQVKEEGKITEGFVRRGQQRYNIYCAPCHGFSGHGDGQVSARNLGLVAKTLHSEWMRGKDTPNIKGYTNGKIYDIIANGVRVKDEATGKFTQGAMGPYAAQIPVKDRWAIVAYVRALQISQAAVHEKRAAAAGQR